MVQVFDLTPTPSSASMLGQSLAQGIARNFPQPEQNVQRGLLQQALQKVRGIAQNPGATPLDVSLALMEAGAGIPGSEKYLSTLLPQILQGQTAANVFGQAGIGGQPEAGQPTPQPEQAMQQPRENLASPIFRAAGIQPQAQPQAQEPIEGAGIQLGQYIPVDVGAYIDPKESSKILSNVLKGGGDGNLAKDLIKNYNEGLIDYNQLLNSNVDRQAAQVQKQLALEGKVKGFIDEQLDPKIPEERKNIYYGWMNKELKKNPDLTSAYQKVSKDIQGFEKQMEEYSSKIPAPELIPGTAVPFGIRDPQERMLQQVSKNIVDKDPLAIPILEKMYQQAGYPATQAAKIVNPLPSQIQSKINKSKDYRPELYPLRFGEVSDAAQLRNIEMVQKQQTREAAQLSKDLSKDWNENLSLINMYTDLKVKGWFPEQIFEFYEGLEKNGVKFSPYQQAERTQLISPQIIPLKYIK